jgi:glucose-1-phosphate thymidylyltransferase
LTEPITIVIPMAGYGTRMRPHTWSKAKPLIHLAGKTVLDYCLAQFDTLPGVGSARWVFICSPFQLDQVKEYMQKVHPEKRVDYVIQAVMRGQSDALFLAREFLHGPMLMSFSDTLIETDLAFLPSVQHDGVAWVKEVPDPRRFGVAEVNSEGWVTRLVEKPADIHNNRAVVGFYYFRSAENLMAAIVEQMEKNIALKGEFFLTDTVNVMLAHGARFTTQATPTWLDAGTRDALLETNGYLLDHGRDNSADAARRGGVKVIPPVFIPADAKLESCTLGPHVSLAEGVEMHNVTVSDAIIERGAMVENSILTHSHLGRDVIVKGARGRLNIGDNSIVEVDQPIPQQE